MTVVCGALASNNTIDFAGYKKMYIDCEGVCNGYYVSYLHSVNLVDYLGGSKEDSRSYKTYNGKYMTLAKQQPRAVLEFDISDISGKHNIYLYCSAGYYTNNPGRWVKYYNIWLEK